MYQEINPARKRSELIDTFWLYSGNEKEEAFKVLPDNCIDLIFDLIQKKAFVSGLMTHYQHKILGRNSNLLGVRIKVENFNLITKIPIRDFNNLREELTTVFPRFNTNYITRILNAPNSASRIILLENFIQYSINILNKKEDQLVLKIASQIRSSKGVLNISILAKNNFISLRQLERRFKSKIGITVKQFSSIVRFGHVKDLISSSQNKNLSKIAFEGGYYDISHMSNEFKRLAGESPSHFK